MTERISLIPRYVAYRRIVRYNLSTTCSHLQTIQALLAVVFYINEYKVTGQVLYYTTGLKTQWTI